MVVRRAAPKKRKPPKNFSRRARTGFDAAPIDSYRMFNDYIRTEVDKKDISQKIKSYIKSHLPRKEAQIALKAPEWMFGSIPFVAAIIAWKEKGFSFPNNGDYEKSLNENIQKLIQAGINKTEIKEENEEEKVNIPQRSPAEIVKERTSEFIANVEEVIDIWSQGVYVDVENYSPYNELLKVEAPYNLAKGVLDYYLPIREEAEDLINGKDKDLVEGYSHMTIKRRKEYFKLLDTIVSDVEKYMASKKAVRKVRKPKVKTADKQVTQIKYLTESSEYKITSVSPVQIIGSHRVYLFNTKSRILSELVCRLPAGFEVKGTTIQGLDSERSRQILLRKPDEFLSIVQKKTPLQISKEWDKLTTKTNETTGRVNKDTIILRILDK